ncbi:hypothetical protein NL676_005103 [Syzygium grande]|nr:hypothetical protein NL676_005103 [Syzygium grande]
MFIKSDMIVTHYISASTRTLLQQAFAGNCDQRIATRLRPPPPATVAATEVVCRRGYNGSKVDVWSYCTILFVLLADFMPFDKPQPHLDLGLEREREREREREWGLVVS